MSTAQEHIQAAQERQKQQADRKRRELAIFVGDDVLLSMQHLNLTGLGKCPKFSVLYVGPFCVVKKYINACRLEWPAHVHSVFNLSKLQLYFRPDGSCVVDHPDPVIRPDGTEEYIVKEILDHRTRHRGLEYLVL